MNTKNTYRTNQKEQVRQCLQAHPGEHMTAMDVYTQLKARGVRIGLTTVYRHLDLLTGEGIAVKSVIDENTPACYEYSGHLTREENPCYHCKCTVCGKLIHLHCTEVTRLEEHILADHGFMVDPARTVFFGICSSCQERNAQVTQI